MSLSDPEVFRSYCLLIVLKDLAARKTFIFSTPSSKRTKGTTKIEQVDRVAQRKGSSFQQTAFSFPSSKRTNGYKKIDQVDRVVQRIGSSFQQTAKPFPVVKEL